MEIPFKTNKIYPTCSADLIITNDRNEILLTRRGVEPYKDYWILPGGHVKEELPIDAVRREIYEEINVEVEIDRLYGLYSSQGKDPRGMRITVAYVGHIISGEPQTTLEVSESKFFSKDDLPENIGFHHRDILKEFFAYPEKQPIK
jgi:8-oxo-dGTP diphosphatase